MMNEFEFILAKEEVAKATTQKKLEQIIRDMHKKLKGILAWSFKSETVGMSHVYSCKIYQLALTKYTAKNAPAFFKSDFNAIHNKILNAVIKCKSLTAEEINLHIKGVSSCYISFYGNAPSEIECLAEIFNEILPVETIKYYMILDATDITLTSNPEFITLLRLRKCSSKSAFIEQELLRTKEAHTLENYKKEIDKLQKLYKYGVAYEKSI